MKLRLLIAALLLSASFRGEAAEGSGTVGYHGVTKNTGPEDLNYRANSYRGNFAYFGELSVDGNAYLSNLVVQQIMLNGTNLETHLNNRAFVVHTHTSGQITDLLGILDTKAASNHTHTISQTTGLQGALDGKAAAVHPHAIADTTGLQTALDGKAATVHGHGIADVSGLQGALDAKAASNHTHTISQTTGLQTALDGKAATSHGHAIADTTGLQSALDGKAASSHNHAAADTTSGTFPLARLPVAADGEVSATKVVRADDSRLSGGSGDVTAASNFGTNDVAVVSDGTTKALKATPVKIDSAGNITTPGEISVQHIRGSEMIVSNAIPASVGGTGRTNWNVGSIPVFNGTNAAGQVQLQNDTGDWTGNTNLADKASIQAKLNSIEAGDGFAGITASGATTNNDDFLTLYSVTLATNRTAQLGAHVLGAGPTNVYGFIVAAVVKNLTGTAEIIGTNNSYIIPAAGTNVTAYWDVNADTARLRVRGTASENVNWVATNILVNLVTNGAALSEGGGGGETFLFGGKTNWIVAFIATEGTSTTTDGQKATTWADQSGNGKDATNGTSDSAPTYRANVLNGLPVLEFDGVNDFLQIASINLTNGTYGAVQSVTIYAVVQVAAGGTEAIYEFSTAVDPPNKSGFLLYRQDANNYVVGAMAGDNGYNTSQSASGLTNAFKVITLTFNKTLGGASETIIKINDAFSDSGGTSNDQSNYFGDHPSFIGSRAGTGMFMQGQIFLLLVAPEDHDSSTETAVYNEIISLTGAL